MFRHIYVFILQFGEASLTGGQIIGVLFAYTDGGVPVSGFGLVLSAGKAAIWSDIYGKDAGFRCSVPDAFSTYVPPMF